MGELVLLYLTLAVLLGASVVYARSVAISDSYVVLGKPFRWKCIVDNNDTFKPLSFLWRFEGADLLGGEESNGMVTATDDGTLVFKEVQEENLGYYTCVVTDDFGTSEGGAYLRKAFVSRIISTKPTNQTAEIGDAVSFHCAVDARPEARVTWIHNDHEIDNMDNVSMRNSENGNFTLEVPSLTYANGGDYRCRAYHDALDEPLLSDRMTLQVVGAPVIVNGLRQMTYPVGYNISLPCQTRGNPVSTVTWRIYPSTLTASSTPSSSSSSLSSSSSSPSSIYTLTPGDPPFSMAHSVVSLNEDGDLVLITNASKESTGVYSCKWLNEFGSVEVNATVTVEGTPQPPEFIEIPPESQDIVEFSELRLRCAGKGNPSVRVSWIIPPGDDNTHNDNVTDYEIDESTLVVKEVNKADRGVYTCIISNKEGTKKTNTIVNVFLKPHFISIPSNISVKSSSYLEIPCKADGYPKPTIKWRLPWLYEEIEATPNNAIDEVSFNETNIVIGEAKSRHYGIYQCIAINEIGSISVLAKVTVLGGPVVVKPLTSVGVTEGDEVLLQCEVKSYQPPKVDWFRRYMPDFSVEAVNVKEALGAVSNEAFNATGAGFESIESIITNTSSLSDLKTFTGVAKDDGYLFYLQIRAIQHKDAGMYVCQISNDEGSVHTFGVVRVNTFPNFITTPSSGKVLLGGDFMLYCHSTGIPVPTQRWLFNGDRLPISKSKYVAFSNGSLSILNITQHEIGTYTCLATNQAGQRAATANVLLSSRPILTLPPRNETLKEYGNGYIRCFGYSSLPFSISWYRTDSDGNDIDLLGEIRVKGNGVENDDLSIENVEKSTVRVNKEGSLVFSCAQESNQGWYQCKLKNEDGSVESEPVFVHVETLPRTVSIATSGEETKEGDNIELQCSVIELSSFRLNISWVTPRFVEITQSGHSFYPELNVKNEEILHQDGPVYLSVLNVTEVDNSRHGGNWWCKVCNSVGCILEKTEVVVKGTPVVRYISSSATETQVTIKCHSYGNPLPNILFSSNDSYITDGMRGHQFKNDTLIIDVTELKTEYLCQASNIYGSHDQNLGFPLTPVITEVTSGRAALYVTTTVKAQHAYTSLAQLNLEYKISNSDHDWGSLTHRIDGEVMKYLFAFRDSHEGEMSNKTCDKNLDKSERVTIAGDDLIRTTEFDGLQTSIYANGDSFTFTFQSIIANLNAYTLYSVRANLTSILGWGALSDVVDKRTLSSAPSTVTNIKVSVQNRSCILSWNNPRQLNGKPEKIYVTIDIYRESSAHIDIARSKTVPVNEAPTAKFNSLSLGEYTATITVFNTEINASSESVEYKFSIQDQAPTYVPDILEIRSVTHTSMIVFWEIPNKPSALIPPVTGYVLLIKTTDSKTSTREIFIDDSITSSRTIRSLLEHQEYSVQIASTNRAGTSTYSRAKRVTTRYTAFSELALDSTGIDGYFISWTLIAIILIGAGAAFVFFTAFLVFSYQWRLAKKGSVDITPEPTTDDVRFVDPGQGQEEEDRVAAACVMPNPNTFHVSDFIMY